MPVEHIHQARVQREKPQGKRAGPRPQRPARNMGKPPTGSLDHAPAHCREAGVDPQYPHPPVASRLGFSLRQP
jgi:hypothetical protein